jgi:hypothetical protein
MVTPFERNIAAFHVDYSSFAADGTAYIRQAVKFPNARVSACEQQQGYL